MNEIEWYYAHDEQQFGPVSTVELKRLADRGELMPSDLVWRQGIPDWVEASQVKGLFPSHPPTAIPKPAAAVQPNPTPAVRATGGSAPKGGPVDRPASIPLRHPVEVVLSAARRNASSKFVDSTIRLFVAAGHYALYVAMVLLLIAGAAISIHQENVVPLLVALAAIPVLAVLQYAASQFCAALARVNRSTRAMIASTTLIDLIGLAVMVTGLFLLLILGTQAITSQAYALVLAALLAFIVCGHFATVSLIHVDENVIVSDELSPGEEALGTLVVLLKASARVVPVAFGAGTCITVVAILISSVRCVLSGEASEMGAIVIAAQTVTLVMYAALPIAGYLVYLLLAMVFDILDGLLTLRHPREEQSTP